MESSVGMAYSEGAAVWSFDPELWGQCAQGQTVEEAIAAWTERFGTSRIVEEIDGDEQAFGRDLEPATDEELETTLHILQRQRERAISLFEASSPEELDRDDPARALPRWARWRTVRQMFWHICDTESRYYLPQLGLPPRKRCADLRDELTGSHEHVVHQLADMPRSLAVRDRGEVWTSTKLLRRLAWHERGELEAIEQLLAGWRGTQ